MAAGSPVRLQIEDLELRSMTRHDATDAFRRWTADPNVMGPMNLPARQLSAAQIADYWGGFDNLDRFFLGVFRGRPQQHIGFVMLETNPVHRTAMLSQAMDPTHQNREIAFLIGIVWKDWLFGTLGIEKLAAVTLASNDRAVQAMERSGWTFEALLRGEVRALSGPGRLDQVRYFMMAEDWPAIRDRMVERWRKATGRVDLRTSITAAT